MFKLIIKLVLLFSLIIILIVVGISSGVINISKINNSNNASQEILTKIREIGNLQLVKFNLNYTAEDTVKNDSLVSVELPENSRILAVINGEADACINLKGIGEEDIRINKDTVCLSMQEPFICNTKVNYEQSKFYDTNFNPHSFNRKMIDKYFPNLENNLKAEAIRMGFLDQAKENSKEILIPILKEMFKKKFVIEFKGF